MDNLELMKQMDSECIDLIYCDILYNTRKKFKDFDDRLGTTQEAIEWYRPRLQEMHRLLKKNGSIYIHCDWHLVHYMKVLMDEIFEEKNFRNEIIWRYKRWTTSSNNKFQSMHDNILFYAKGNNKITHQYEPLEKPRMYQNRKDKNGDVVRNEDGTVKYFPQTVRQIDDVWEIPFLNPRAKERVGYDTQKPKALLERIIKASSNEGDVVADFFCGSGTTLVVAKELGRQYIGCDINPRAIEITEKRLRENDLIHK
jgi:site-specific DNA-methyltransferase (adenine-specific)